MEIEVEVQSEDPLTGERGSDMLAHYQIKAYLRNETLPFTDKPSDSCVSDTQLTQGLVLIGSPKSSSGQSPTPRTPRGEEVLEHVGVGRRFDVGRPLLGADERVAVPTMFATASAPPHGQQRELVEPAGY